MRDHDGPMNGSLEKQQLVAQLKAARRKRLRAIRGSVAALAASLAIVSSTMVSQKDNAAAGVSSSAGAQVTDQSVITTSNETGSSSSTGLVGQLTGQSSDQPTTVVPQPDQLTTSQS